MPTESTHFSRQEFYKLLWVTPITKICERHRVAYLDVVAACKRHLVPRPPMGYWVRRAKGQQPVRPPLAELTTPELQTVELAPAPLKGKGAPFGRRRRPEPPEPSPIVDPEIAALIVAERSQPAIIVPPKLTRPHQATRLTRQSLENAVRNGQPDPFGMYLASGYRATGAVYVAVSPGMVGRAMVICDTFMKEFARQRAKFEPCSTHGKYGLRILLRGELLWLKMREKAKQLARHQKVGDAQPSNLERLDRRRTHYTPTGRLTVELHGEYGRQRVWADTDEDRVEDQIRPVLIGALELVAEMREIRERWRREEEEQHRRELRRQEPPGYEHDWEVARKSSRIRKLLFLQLLRNRMIAPHDSHAGHEEYEFSYK